MDRRSAIRRKERRAGRARPANEQSSYLLAVTGFLTKGGKMILPWATDSGHSAVCLSCCHWKTTPETYCFPYFIP
jgi:hypothetical protein